MWIEKTVKIKDLEKLLETHEVEIDSPDGFVPVTSFINKGEWDEYVLTLVDGRTVSVNEDHLFETTSGWKSTKSLLGSAEVFLTDVGYLLGSVSASGRKIPIVDLNIDHENSRYYANGVSSHNTGVGKSMFMCHFAASVLSMGKNVLYITMEMAEEKIAERIDANLLNATLDELPKMTAESFTNKIQKLVKKTQGKLIIKEYPNSSAHAGHFRALLEELKNKKKFKPDVIIVDYLNICASSRIKFGNGSSYTIVKAIAEELRALAQEYEVPILSATQVNRDGMNSSDIDLTNTSESIGLPQTVDLMFALISTEELENLNQILVKQLKNRYNDLNYYKRFVVGIDRARMKFYDVENSAQSSLSDPGKTDTKTDKANFGKKMKDAGDGFVF